MTQRVDVVVLGAGAAGLMAARTAGRRGRSVLLLDHAERAGAKILISGGGRCNFTNRDCVAERFFSDNPAFCRSALARYTPADFLAEVEGAGIAWHHKTLGQLFCDGSARQIVDMLLAGCGQAGVSVRLGARIGAVRRAAGPGGRFVVETDAGAVSAASVVLASGGLSIPKLGATGLAYEVARRMGLALTALRPALVGLRLEAAALARLAPLAGVSLVVEAAAGSGAWRRRFREAMLFTHRGLSGPAILQASSCWREGEAMRINLLPDAGPEVLLAAKRGRPRAGLARVLGEHMPQRLAEAMLPPELAARPVGELRDRQLGGLLAGLQAMEFRPDASEGYAKAEVTLGGVDTRALSSRTLEARGVPGLHVVGEAVDVTGWLGGYNFQWAWSSGVAAGAAA